MIAIGLCVLAGRAAETPASPLALFPVLPVWTTPLDGNLASPPAFGANRMFVALDSGRLSAYSLQTGTREWTLDGAVAGPLTVSDSRLFFSTKDGPSAVDVKSGELVWHTHVEDYSGGPVVFDADALLAVIGPKSIGLFRATDGHLVWRRDLDAGIHAAPTLAMNRAYLSLDDGRVFALDGATGEPIWSRKLGEAGNEVLALEDRVYVGSDDNYFYCLFARDGSVNWRWRTGGDVIGMPLSDGNRVYFVSKDNVVRSLDRRSGAQRWKRAMAGRPTRGVVQAGDAILASGIAPRIWAFAMKDGAPAGDVTTSGELASQPYVQAVNGVPWLVLAARDISAGARLMGFRRDLEPALNTPLTAVPGAIALPQPGVAGGAQESPQTDANAMTKPTSAPPSTAPGAPRSATPPLSPR